MWDCLLATGDILIKKTNKKGVREIRYDVLFPWELNAHLYSLPLVASYDKVISLFFVFFFKLYFKINLF